MSQLEFIPYPLLVGLAGLGGFLIIQHRRGRGFWALCGWAVFGGYLLAVAAVTLFPIPFVTGGAERQSLGDVLARVNLIPLNFGGLFLLAPAVIFRELAGNVMLTLPLGFGAGALGRRSARQVLGLALGAGGSIEAAQLALSVWVGAVYRGVDVNDVLLNALGVLLGAVLFQVFSRAAATFGRAKPRG